MVELSHLSGGQWFNFKRGLKYEEETIVESFNLNNALLYCTEWLAQLQCSIQKVTLQCNTLCSLQYIVTLWCPVHYSALLFQVKSNAVQ